MAEPVAQMAVTGNSRLYYREYAWELYGADLEISPQYRDYTIYRGRAEQFRASGLPDHAELPLNTMTTLADGGWLLRLGPDYWLGVFPRAPAGQYGCHSALALNDSLLQLDAAGQYMAVSIEGHNAVPLLNSFCALDLRDSVFPAMSATRTRFEKVPAVLCRLPVEGNYLVLVESSLFEHFTLMLETAAQEFGPVHSEEE